MMTQFNAALEGGRLKVIAIKASLEEAFVNNDESQALETLNELQPDQQLFIINQLGMEPQQFAMDVIRNTNQEPA